MTLRGEWEILSLSCASGRRCQDEQNDRKEEHPNRKRTDFFDPFVELFVEMTECPNNIEREHRHDTAPDPHNTDG